MTVDRVGEDGNSFGNFLRVDVKAYGVFEVISLQFAGVSFLLMEKPYSGRERRGKKGRKGRRDEGGRGEGRKKEDKVTTKLDKNTDLLKVNGISVHAGSTFMYLGCVCVCVCVCVCACACDVSVFVCVCLLVRVRTYMLFVFVNVYIIHMC